VTVALTRKHRAAHETRTIPIPPDLVKLLRAHIRRYGTTPDGRIFQTARGGIIQDSAYSAVWAEARKQALTEAQYRAPLGRRPYDLRHAAASLWLNSGVPATEVARRAGHGVAVLLKVYAHCIDGQANAANTRINEALGTRIPSPTPLTRAMRATARMSRHHEAAGQRQESGWAVSLTAPTVSSVDFRPLSVDFSAPKFGAHGHIADGGNPETSLEAHNRRSAGGASGGASGL
jgi:hypothetical protein